MRRKLEDEDDRRLEEGRAIFFLCGSTRVEGPNDVVLGDSETRGLRYRCGMTTWLFQRWIGGKRRDLGRRLGLVGQISSTRR